jgi:dCMP deaminase
MDWNQYFMGFAQHAAKKSKDSTKVGAILVDPKGSVILTAFNGPPRGVNDSPERFERPLKYMYASHAEANLIAFAARHGIRTEDCTVVTTHMPCASCTRTLIQAGIKTIMYGPGEFQSLVEEREHTTSMCLEAQVSLIRCDKITNSNG